MPGLLLTYGGGGGKPTSSVSVGIVLFGALALQDVTAYCVLPELTKLMEGAGMKGCSVLEIKVTNNKAFVLRLV